MERVLKTEYEKPIAVPLGEAAKGSGQCNAGSGVGVVGGGVGVAWNCNSGGYAQSDCSTGSQAGWGCAPGQWTGHICSGGTSPYRVNPSVAGIFPLSNVLRWNLLLISLKESAVLKPTLCLLESLS